MLWKPLNGLRLAQLVVSHLCRKEEDVDPEQIRKDMERLELIKRKRYNCPFDFPIGLQPWLAFVSNLSISRSVTMHESLCYWQIS